MFYQKTQVYSFSLILTIEFSSPTSQQILLELRLTAYLKGFSLKGLGMQAPQTDTFKVYNQSKYCHLVAIYGTEV